MRVPTRVSALLLRLSHHTDRSCSSRFMFLDPKSPSNASSSVVSAFFKRAETFRQGCNKAQWHHAKSFVCQSFTGRGTPVCPISIGSAFRLEMPISWLQIAYPFRRCSFRHTSRDYRLRGQTFSLVEMAAFQGSNRPFFFIQALLRYYTLLCRFTSCASLSLDYSPRATASTT